MAQTQRSNPQLPDYVPFEPPFRRAFYPVEDFARPQAPPTAADTQAGQLALALANIEPGLNTFLGQMSAKERQQDAAQAYADYASNAKAWGDAVRDNPDLASKSPFYKQAWQEAHAQNQVFGLATQLGPAYQNSPVRYSSDPKAVDQWLSQQIGQWKQGLGDVANDPYFSRGLAKPLEQLRAHVLERHEADMVNYNHEQLANQFGAQAVNTISGYLTSGRGDMHELGGMINDIFNTPKFVGMDSKQADDLMFQAVDAVARATKNVNLYQALGVPRQDVRNPSQTLPSYADTGAGLQKIQEAITRLQAQKHSDASFEWTQQEHAQKLEAQNIIGGLADRVAHGDYPNLDDPQVNRLMILHNSTYADAMKAVQERRNLQNYLSPQDANNALMHFYLDPNAAGQSFAQRLREATLQPGNPLGRLPNSEYDRQLKEALRFDQTHFWDLPELKWFHELLNKTNPVVEGKHALSLVDRDPSAPMRIMFDFASNGALDWVAQHPTASPDERAKALAPMMDQAIDRDKQRYPQVHDNLLNMNEQGPITPESMKQGAMPGAQDTQHSALEIRSGVDTANVHPV